MSARARPALSFAIAGAVCAAAAAALDGVLLEVTRGGFGNGFGGVLLDTTALRLRYAATAFAANGFAIALGWAVLVPIARRLTQRPHRVLAICVLSALGASVWANVLLYELHTTIGALITPGIAMELAGNDVSSFDEAGAIASAVLGVGGVASTIAMGIGIRIADALAGAGASTRRLDAPARPRGRALLAHAAWIGVATALALGVTSRDAVRVREALSLQPAAAFVTALVERASDVDGDGVGWLAQPPDGAPFDPARHPHAIDIAGNGIDENELAGDLPLDARAPEPIAAPAPPGTLRARPHVLVIYLESFRYDVLGSRLDGKPVTPFFDSLAREGASSAHAYVHSPYTVRSRGQLFGGALDPQPGQHTWIDDFAARGYRTAHFSGQDDSFGDSEPLLGVARADHFYDARSDTARRTSRSTAPASLQVSWKLLLERVRAFLADARASDPLFLYVNVVDTHYPYTHGDLDSILGVEPVDRSRIRSWNREAVWRTYLEAAANVDRAAEMLVGSFREAIGGAPHAILVTSDHGQSIYDDGSLGHGRALDRLQTHVPLIVTGLGGTWPEPLGAADLRGLVLRAIDSGARGGVHFEPDPQRRVFQYLPTLERPSAIASRSQNDAWIYDFARGRASHEDGSPVADDAPELRTLIHEWEALRSASR